MLTTDKLKIYADFDGDIDGWARMAGSAGKQRMQDADWRLIDELLMGLVAVSRGLAAPEFSRELESRILAATADDAAREALRALAARQLSRGG